MSALRWLGWRSPVVLAASWAVTVTAGWGWRCRAGRGDALGGWPGSLDWPGRAGGATVGSWRGQQRSGRARRRANAPASATARGQEACRRRTTRRASDCCAAWFTGNVKVTGQLFKPGGGFQIDHPLDPAEKFLAHSFVESPDMKNVCDGVVVADATGKALVELPDWFEALNQDSGTS